MKNVATLLITVLAMLTFACKSNKVTTISKTNLSQKQALEIAAKTAKENNVDLIKYQVKSCHYGYVVGDKCWTIFYELNPPGIPGGHFSILVNDFTKEARFFGGQ